MDSLEDQPKNSERAVVAMSGGVDSGLSALLLKDAGYEVIGMHFLLPTSEKMKNLRLEQVRSLAMFLNIPLEVMDLGARFKRLVIDPFVDSYLKGLTPNPCVLCNETIKFDQLLVYADAKGIDYLATGHYARVIHEGNEEKGLERGVDQNKEQSYFLHRLQQRHLERLILPLGEMTKVEARQIAREKGLPHCSQPESQEICFIPENDYRAFLESQKLDLRSDGDIVDRSGRRLGRHQGIYRYTIGQRHGLGIASERPYYVLALDPVENRVLVGRKEELYQEWVEAEDFNWIKGKPSPKELKALAQIRYRHRAASGSLSIISETQVRFCFDKPQTAITPGQALVCYDGNRLLGGGWIRRKDEG